MYNTVNIIQIRWKTHENTPTHVHTDGEHPNVPRCCRPNRQFLITVRGLLINGRNNSWYTLGIDEAKVSFLTIFTLWEGGNFDTHLDMRLGKNSTGPGWHYIHTHCKCGPRHWQMSWGPHHVYSLSIYMWERPQVPCSEVGLSSHHKLTVPHRTTFRNPHLRYIPSR